MCVCTAVAGGAAVVGAIGVVWLQVQALVFWTAVVCDGAGA